MIINVHNLFRNNGGKSILEKIAYLLPSCTRDTDIAGWYDYGSVMGVIFTETNVVNKDLIGEKIYNNLCNILDSEQIKKIEISYHAFPEEYDKPKLDPSWEFTLNSDWQARADYNLSLPAHNGNVNFVAEP
ncbi:MAG TPA: hypothetical protein ENG95_00125 [Nitrospirae bacterium]|nr:hypothetical protein [Nitrospirota bacterium]